MSIENIEHPELKRFAKDAKEDGWDINYEIGFLKLSGHKIFPDIEIFWEKGNEDWKLKAIDDKIPNETVSSGKLKYPKSITSNF